MGLTVLYGEHPCDVSDDCLSRICDEAIAWPTRRGYLIVPEQSKADVERRYIEILTEKKKSIQSSGFMLIDIVSFSRFAYRIMSEVGGAPGYSPDVVAKSLLIYRILKEEKDNLTTLSAFSDNVGFVAKIDEVLGDFDRYGITGDMLLSLSLESESAGFRAKTHDFGLLMNRLAEKRAEYGFASDRNTLKQLISTLETVSKGEANADAWPLNRLRFLKDASIWVMGFAEDRFFTPEELKLISLLEVITEKVCVTALSHSTQDEDPTDITYFGKAAIRALRKEVRHPITLTKTETAKQRATGLVRLSSCFAARTNTTETDAPQKENKDIRLLLFQTPFEEISYIAATIRKRVALDGMRYRDFSIVLCDEEKYRTPLHAAFAEYGLDAFLDRRQALCATSWMRYVLALLDLAASGGKYQYLMTILKSGLCPCNDEAVSRFENYCLAYGLDKQSRIMRHSLYESEEGKAIWTEMSPVLQTIFTLSNCMAVSKSCKEKATILFDHLQTKGEIVDALAKEWADSLQREAALGLVASYQAMMDILVTLSGDLGDCDMEMENFRSTILIGMETQKAGAIPSFIDQIEVTTPSLGYKRRTKVMFIVGANRGNFPYSAISEGYLRGTERQMIAEKLCISFPNKAKDQVYKDFFTAYALLDCPTEQLYMTTLSNVEPSSVMRFAQEIMPELEIERILSLSMDDPRLYQKERLIDYLRTVILRVTNPSDDEFIEAIALWKKYFSGEKLFTADSVCHIQIPKSQMEERFHNRLTMSVSQIENYAACPYSYFAEKVLSLSKRREVTPEYTETGTILHRVMELAMQQMTHDYWMQGHKDTKAWIDQYLSADIPEWSRRLVRKAEAEGDYGYAKDEALKTETEMKLTRVASHTLEGMLYGLQNDNYVPRYFEWKFGEKEDGKLELSLPTGQNVTFRGTIDRVDINENEHSFRVLDYKTGNKKVEYDKLFAGLSVQLPAYTYVFGASHPEWLPKKAGYIHVSTSDTKDDTLEQDYKSDTIRDLALKSREKLTKPSLIDGEPEDMAAIGRHAIHAIEKSCTSLFEGKFDPTPAKIEGKPAARQCKDCEYRMVCSGSWENPRYRRIPKLQETRDEGGMKKKAYDIFLENISEEEKNR